MKVICTANKCRSPSFAWEAGSCILCGTSKKWLKIIDKKLMDLLLGLSNRQPRGSSCGLKSSGAKDAEALACWLSQQCLHECWSFGKSILKGDYHLYIPFIVQHGGQHVCMAWHEDFFIPFQLHLSCHQHQQAGKCHHSFLYLKQVPYRTLLFFWLGESTKCEVKKESCKIFSQIMNQRTNQWGASKSSSQVASIDKQEQEKVVTSMEQEETQLMEQKKRIFTTAICLYHHGSCDDIGHCCSGQWYCPWDLLNKCLLAITWTHATL